MCDPGLYFGYLWGNRFPEFFTHKGAILDKELFLSLARLDGLPLAMNDPSICKNVQLGLIVGQEPVLRWQPEV